MNEKVRKKGIEYLNIGIELKLEIAFRRLLE